jgi:hypothetical protein
MQPPSLRSLDALHPVAGLALGATLSALVSYEQRMPRAAGW